MVTLKQGAWFGDFQIMLDVPSVWDLVADSSIKEYNKNGASD